MAELEKRVEWLELQMRLVHKTLDKIDRKDEPQTNADQHVQHVGSVEPMQTEREGE